MALSGFFEYLFSIIGILTLAVVIMIVVSIYAMYGFFTSREQRMLMRELERETKIKVLVHRQVSHFSRAGTIK